MRISEEGIDFIKQWESFEPKAYLCPAKVWTIGYGHTGDVNPGDEITEEMAEELLEADLAQAEDAVNDFVDVDLEQCEYDMLVSFTFNVGTEAFRGSTLLKLLNGGRKESAASQFEKWCKANGKVINGLLRRRLAEREIFSYGYQREAREA